MRFLKEYANFTINRIKKDEYINPGIRKEIVRRLEKYMEMSRRGQITLDETMRLISMHGMQFGEDMSEYAIPNWEPFCDL